MEPQPSTSTGGQANDDSDNTTEQSEYEPSGCSSDSSDAEHTRKKRRVVPRCKKWQLKVRGKEKKSSTPPQSENNSDETVVIKNELEQNIQPGMESDLTTGYPLPSRVTVAEVHAPKNNDSDGSIIVLD